MQSSILKLSGGLLRRLNIACGVVHKPKLIILDEPTLQLILRVETRSLKELSSNEQGATIIYTSHYMER